MMRCTRSSQPGIARVRHAMPAGRRVHPIGRMRCERAPLRLGRNAPHACRCPKVGIWRYERDDGCTGLDHDV
jgi:hypothetical protein